MINYNNLTITRLIMHEITAKQDQQDNATTTYSNSLLQIDDSVIDIIKHRLIDAAGKDSRAFELELENTQADSFYHICQNLKDKTNAHFIQATKNLVDLLAEKQTRRSIPGGYFIVIDAMDSDNTLPVYIVIKAEPHEALRRSNAAGGQTQIQLLQDVFLSPSQKLYKIGILNKKENPIGALPNNVFGCFLFDHQFRPDSHPAEYFYRDFLGFSTSSNAKIQSQRFYDKSTSFVKNNFDDVSQKTELLQTIKNQFTIVQEPLLSPIEFASEYMPEGELRDSFIANVVSEFQGSFEKDSTLIENRLSKRRMNFPEDINLTGPDEDFDRRVEIVNSEDIFNQLSPEDETYTIVKIYGKPYSNE